MHHDLGRDSESKETELTCGNVIAKIIAKGHVRTVYWVIPIPEKLLRSNAADFLNTLPLELGRKLELTSEGRYVGSWSGITTEVRGADDLPIIHGNEEAAISYDLDFHYSRRMAGPTIDPVTWLNNASCLFRSICVKGVFLAHGFGDGYTPPTYRPIAYMFEQWRLLGALPTWHAELWKRVCICEKQRLGLKYEDTQMRESSLPDELQKFFESWALYMESDFETASMLFSSLPPLLRFNPFAEIRVEYQNNSLPPLAMINRVKNSYRYFASR